MASNLRSRARAKAHLQTSPKAPSNPGPGESASPPVDPNNPDDKVKCAICLGDLVNRSYSNNCCHNFCFACLLEWSKVKPECPLCKSSFTSIYHNIRSIDDYDEYHVPPAIRTPPPIQFPSINHLLHLHPMQDDIVTIRSHRYHPYGPSSMNQAAVYHPFRTRSHFRIVEYVPFHRRNEINPFRGGPTEYFGTSISLHNDNVPSGNIRNYQARRRIYDRAQWVQPMNSVLPTGSAYSSSVEYIQTHPVSRGRIVSWLHRELTVLLGLQMSIHELADIFDVIMSVLDNYDIRCREFRELVTTYFADRTRHFQHEFYYFVVSGLGMDEYDARARYSSTGPGRLHNPSPPLVVVLDDSEEEIRPVPPVPAREDSDCIVIQEELPSTSRGRPAASSSSAHPMSSYVDGPWDLTLGNSEGTDIRSTGTSDPYRSMHAAPSATGSFPECSRRSGVLPNDFSPWEARRNRDVYDSSVVSGRHRTGYCPENRGIMEVTNARNLVTPPYDSRGTVDDNFYRLVRPSCSRSRRSGFTSGLLMESMSSSSFSSISGSTDTQEQSSSGGQHAPDEEDCVVLGVHPVVKKPPLAVITISDSSDEEPSTSRSAMRETENTGRSEGQSRLQPQYKNEVPEIPDLGMEPDSFLQMCNASIEIPTTSRRPTRTGRLRFKGSTSAIAGSLSPTSSSSELSSTPVVSYGFSTSTSLVEDVNAHVASISSGIATSIRLRLLDSKKPKSKSKKSGSHSRSSRSTSSKTKSKAKSHKKRRRSGSSDDAYPKHGSKRVVKSAKKEKSKHKLKKRKAEESSLDDSDDSTSSMNRCSSGSETDFCEDSGYPCAGGSASQEDMSESKVKRAKHKKKKSKRSKSSKSGVTKKTLTHLSDVTYSSSDDATLHATMHNASARVSLNSEAGSSRSGQSRLRSHEGSTTEQYIPLAHPSTLQVGGDREMSIYNDASSEHALLEGSGLFDEYGPGGRMDFL